tara:strand:- start:1559 stop:1783 length:225 start_codon:yes stop_codon:yes gene_type:complete
MTKEFIIWGHIAGDDASDGLKSQILHTQSKTSQEACKVMQALSKEHGCHNMRVQVFDLNSSMDIRKAFAKSVNI